MGSVWSLKKFRPLTSGCFANAALGRGCWTVILCVSSGGNLFHQVISRSLSRIIQIAYRTDQQDFLRFLSLSVA